MALVLRKVDEDASTITLSWDPVPGARGYLLYRERSPVVEIPSGGSRPRYSQTFDPDRSSAIFSRDSAWYAVDAIAVVASGAYPPRAVYPSPSLYPSEVRP